MKSFLVDALRQSVDTSADEASAKHDGEVPATVNPATGRVGHIDAVELDLLDPRDEAVRERADQSGPLTAHLSLETVDEPDSRPFAATEILASRGAVLSGRVSVFERAGRLAPAFCLVALSVSAGGYMLVNHAPGNPYIAGNRSGAAEVNSSTGAETVSWQTLPVTDVSVVTSAEERKARDVAKEASASRTAVAVEAGTASRSTTPVGRPANSNIQIGVTRNAESIVNDGAYASVRVAFDAYRKQDYRTAETRYQRALEIEPYHADALAGLAAVYQQTGRDALAAGIYQKLLGFDPENTRAASAIIALRSKDANWDTESDLKYLLQRFPKAHHLHFALGSYFVEQGRWADARHEFLAAHELAPRNADYSFNVAVSMEYLGEHKLARTFYEMALDTAGESSNVDKDAVAEHLSVMLAQSREHP